MKKSLFLVLLFTVTIIFNVELVSADCSKYGCATCEYSANPYKITYKLESNGTSDINKELKIEKFISDSPYENTYTDNITIDNFIDKENNKIICPAKLYLKAEKDTKPSLTKTNYKIVSAPSEKNMIMSVSELATPIFLDYTSENNDKTITGENIDNTPINDDQNSNNDLQDNNQEIENESNDNNINFWGTLGNIKCGNSTLPEMLPSITRTIVTLIKIVTPLVLIFMGMIDMMQAVIASDDKK